MTRILSSFFQLTVIYDSGIKKQFNSKHKEVWLLLNSDVGGTNHKPGFCLFERKSSYRKERNL